MIQEKKARQHDLNQFIDRELVEKIFQQSNLLNYQIL